MKIRVLSLILCLFAVTLLGAQQPSDDSDEALDRKIKLLRDQIEALRKKQSPLVEEQKKRLDAKLEKERERKQKEDAERKAKEEAEKKARFPKIELRGRLDCHVIVGSNFAHERWYVTINEQRYWLEYGAKGEPASLTVGKDVTISGKLEVQVATNRILVRPAVDPPKLNPPQRDPRVPAPLPPVDEPYYINQTHVAFVIHVESMKEN